MKEIYSLLLFVFFSSCSSLSDNSNSVRDLTLGFDDKVWLDQEVYQDSILVNDNYTFGSSELISSIEVYLDSQDPYLTGSNRDLVRFVFSTEEKLIYSEKYIDAKIVQRRVFNDSLYKLLDVYIFDSTGNVIDTIPRLECCPACFPCN